MHLLFQARGELQGVKVMGQRTHPMRGEFAIRGSCQTALSCMFAQGDRYTLWVSIWIGLDIFLGSMAALDYVAR